MKAFVLGTPDDIRGFALAGVRGVACESAGDVERAAVQVRSQKDLALLVVSEPVLKLAPEAIAQLATDPPAILVLP